MFCQNCGNEIIDDNALFCSKCGQKINTANDNIVIENIPSNKNEGIAYFFMRLILSLIVGGLCGFISFLFLGETLIFIIAPILTALFFAIIVKGMLSGSNLSGLIAVILFILTGFLYLYAFSTINSVGYDFIVQDVAMVVYGSSPFVMWAMFITDRREGSTLRRSVFKQISVWVAILVFLFITFNVERNTYIEEINEAKNNEINNGYNENGKVSNKDKTSTNELTNSNSENTTTNNNDTDVDINTSNSDLEQTLFDSVNYALSIGLTSNCNMSQEALKELYEKIEDGSFFEESMFSYVTEYGKDRYNYEITYDSLNVIVYCDYTTGLYGFDIKITD